jgi:hypothetical protein
LATVQQIVRKAGYDPSRMSISLTETPYRES